MKRAAGLAFAAAVVLAGAAAAQLVELTRCHAAFPCSSPFGLRPAGSVGNSAFANPGQGNTAIGFEAGVEDGLKPKVIRHPVSEDPVESAARLYVKKNPLKPTPTPTPAPAPASAPAPKQP